MKKWLILLFVILLTGCAKQTASVSNEIYMPIIADASWLEADGAFLNGVHLAVETMTEKCAAEGYTIRVEIIDDGAVYERGVEAATELANDPAVTAVFNLQNFDVSKTTAGILSDGGKMTLFAYGAYDSLFEQNDPLLFCGVAAFSDLGKAMGQYAVSHGYNRIAVYHNGIQSQEELVTAFERSLLNTDTKVVDYVPQIASSGDFDQIDKRWTALGVDCVVISQYGLDEAFRVLDLIRSKQAERMVIGEPIFNRANALADFKTIAEGMVVPTTQVIENSQALEDFALRYQEVYGVAADSWAIQGYDMTSMIIETALQNHTTDSLTIAKALHANGYQGVGGNKTFLEGGALVVDIDALEMLTCHDGMFQ
ncbi:ABC transporter substrate-binding protein [Fusibacter paucivorans]|uniref:ABC transporter substrate-binding protein n=1 Tax=Fusibacter paucivorans TaxID=76009 RepID=A0ABS5PLT2_9FIRM|nr:ABC transporter substrate-binding protein [Fusibacter paucivorans]MBS7525364.1 ABC transporter substrate-binding protein [Fusibacter paucivorans]